MYIHIYASDLKKHGTYGTIAQKKAINVDKTVFPAFHNTKYFWNKYGTLSNGRKCRKRATKNEI